MLLSDLPPTIWLKIFDHLPLIDIIRSGGVDQNFRRASIMALSHLKFLDVTKANLENRTLDKTSFSGIMDLCYLSVKKIKFGDWEPPNSDQNRVQNQDRSDPLDPMISRLVPILSYLYHCPNLIDLDLGGVDVDPSDFEVLIENYPNLRSLNFQGFPFPTEMIWANLESVRVKTFDETTAKSMIDIVPNLRHFAADIICLPDNETMDQFLKSVPKLESLELQTVRYDFSLFTLPKFPYLKSLIIKSGHFEEGELITVARSCPLLEVLTLHYVESITDQVLREFSNLKNLRVISLDSSYIIAYFDPGFQIFMAECGPNLEVIHLPTCALIDIASFISIVRHGNRLRQLTLFGVKGLDTGELVVEFLEKCAGFGPRNIQVRLKVVDDKGTWRSEEVLTKLGALELEDQVVIKVENFKD